MFTGASSPRIGHDRASSPSRICRWAGSQLREKCCVISVELKWIASQVRYAEHLPCVLEGITCTFPGKKNIGIVGRTGSGKSTLIQAIFRVVEPLSGRIFIDDIEIGKIGLHDLRSRLCIIPQDPTMFAGTVRDNLDPLEEYSDDQIWEVCR